MKLEYLSAYLPYKINCVVEGYDKPLPMISAYDDNEHGCGASLQEVAGNDFGFNPDEFKLILLSLSELSKIHIDTMLSDLLIDNPDTIALIQTITQPLASKCGINNRLPNSVFCWLLERGYDIYGLITSGDAVSKNSL